MTEPLGGAAECAERPLRLCGPIVPTRMLRSRPASHAGEDDQRRDYEQYQHKRTY